jgi:hypothetical protein
MEALDFETEPASKVVSARLGRVGARTAPLAGDSELRPDVSLRI